MSLWACRNRTKDGHLVILEETDQSHSRQDHAMTAHDIDLRRLGEDRLTGASPDLLRDLSMSPPPRTAPAG